MKQNGCIAMLLAGGQGSRLGVLTKNVAKPAVSYGGKYRIIDFPLSNCANSGINTVGVLTQYQPLELNDYIGTGRPWDLDRHNGGVHVLPPYQKNQGGGWYKGTANAIFQNFRFIERYNPEYVLILSGDHIYKMDYTEMLDVHKKSGADCTIAVMEVPREEASRFGIMSVRDDGSISEFEEKPANPKSNLASMGIYVFNWPVLRRYLEEDDADPESSNDFGRDVIPKMLNDNCRMWAYRFGGYWKDVGTVNSLWEANLDLLSPKSGLNLADPGWKIYSRNPVAPPQHIADSADIENSLVTEGCEIAGTVDFSVLSENVTVEEGAGVYYSIVMPGAVIKKGAKVYYSVLAENVRVERGAVVGEDPQHSKDLDNWGVAVVGGDLTVGENAFVRARSMVDNDVCAGETV